MSRFDIYVFLLCLIVFTLLTTLLTVLIGYIVKLIVRLIREGVEDEKIKTEYFKAKEKKQSKALSIADKAFSATVFALFFLLFVVSMFVNVGGTKLVGDIPRLQVVSSASMSKKLSSNKYLYQNGLNDQFDTFDVIVTHKLPAEADLKLYDIVVYEVDDLLVVHRIVGIEEPNDKHPNERHFLLQGDNVENPDRFPVRYSQMKGIYRGKRIPFVGSLVMFMQSPAGILCVLLIVYAMIATPLVNKKLEKEKALRIEAILKKIEEMKAEQAEAEKLGLLGVVPKLEDIPIPEDLPIPIALAVEKKDEPVAEQASKQTAKQTGEDPSDLEKQKKGKKKRGKKGFEDPIAHVVLRTEDEELSETLKQLGLDVREGKGFIHTGDMGLLKILRKGEEISVNLKTESEKEAKE